MKHTIIRNDEIRSGVFRMEFDFADIPTPGQFVMIDCGGNTLLKRPFSICDFEKDKMTVVYEVRGKGTYNLSKMKISDEIDVTGPHGHGFDIFDKYNNILVVGGGIGIPPLLFLSKKLKSKNINIVLGFRSDAFLIDEFSKYGNVLITTEDGSYGMKGYVTDVIKEIINEADIIYGCGPKPMLNAVKDISEKYKIPCQISVEERMGCGIGACMTCACKTVAEDGYHYKKVCKDGPVFWAQEVVF